MLARSALLAVLACAFIGCQSVTTIEQGGAYRAVGLTSASFKKAIEENEIRTVVNLSGFDPGAEWYRGHAEICRENQVRKVDLRINPDGPDREEISRLLDAIAMEQRPILFHSTRSWDSVGLASGIYRLTAMQDEKQAARKELPFWSWRRWPVRRLQNFDEFLYDWRNEDEFHATYQLETPQRRGGNAERLASPGAGSAPAVSLGLPIQE